VLDIRIELGVFIQVH